MNNVTQLRPEPASTAEYYPCLEMDNRTDLTCARCGQPFTIPSASWHVEDVHGGVCGPCAHGDGTLAPMQRHAEISRLIDAHLAQFDDRGRRAMWTARLVADVEWFANWRHEDQERIDLGLPDPEEPTPRSNYAPDDDE